MKLDFVLDSYDPKNLTLEQCKAWWDKKQKEGYFVEKQYGFSRPDIIARFGLRNADILEVGCGYGRETVKFAELGKTTGIDISEHQIRVLREEFPQIRFETYDGVHLPFPDASFDFVYSCFVTQHMKKDDVKVLMQEALRVLRAHGRGFILFEFFSGNYCAGFGKEHYSGGLDGMYNNGWLKQEIVMMLNSINSNAEWIEDYLILDDGTKNLWVCVKK